MSRRGFTLIELLVVIAIIGILSTLVIASLGTSRAKGRDATRVSDIKNIQLALQLYAGANGYVYPANLSVLSPTYLGKVPTDPSTGASYTYAQLSSGTSYHLGASLELNNDVLNNDADSTQGFDGTHTTCGGTTGADQCFDVMP